MYVRVVHMRILRAAGEKMAKALSMLEGSFPVSALVPSLHQLLHYPAQTARFASLKLYAMWYFEMLNRRLKSFFVRNNSNPLTSAGLHLLVIFAC